MDGSNIYSLNSAPWMTLAQHDFENSAENITCYLLTSTNKSTNFDTQNGMKFSNIRYKIADQSLKPHLLLPSKPKQDPTYDAFEEDIGMIKVFFETNTLLPTLK